MEYYLKVVKDNYANFNGRARRKEYWMFVLFHIIAIVVIGAVDGAIGTYPLLYVIYLLGTIVPTYAVMARRMHDVGKSGWYMLIPIYSFILAVTEGEMGENIYGEDPKALESNF